MKTIEDRKIQMECILILGANLLWHKYNNIPMVQLVHFPQTCATVFTISVWVTLRQHVQKIQGTSCVNTLN